ncbi:MAG: hypothetical protein U5N53_12095 [Mycobacterium sp.]|nr:hypothetical protein [Mycobacterium sp.]
MPPGAVPDLWTEAGVRDVYSQIGHVAVSPDLLKCPAVTVLAEQRRDGSIGCIDMLLDVEMESLGMLGSVHRTLAAQLAALPAGGRRHPPESWATTVITTAGPGRGLLDLRALGFLPAAPDGDPMSSHDHPGVETVDLHPLDPSAARWQASFDAP